MKPVNELENEKLKANVFREQLDFDYSYCLHYKRNAIYLYQA